VVLEWAPLPKMLILKRAKAGEGRESVRLRRARRMNKLGSFFIGMINS